MHQTKKGNQWYFGMKAHFGVDSRTKLIHAVVAAPANVADSTVLPDLLQADQHHRLAAPVVGYRREREAADAQHEGRADGDPAGCRSLSDAAAPWPAPAASR
jgi:IS5 family transposase